MKKLFKKVIKITVIGYVIYKLRLDEKLIRALEPYYRDIVESLKPKAT